MDMEKCTLADLRAEDAERKENAFRRGGEILGAEAEALIREAEDVGGVKLLVRVLEHVDAKRLRTLAGATMNGNALTVLFSDTGDRVSYLLASNGIKTDMGVLIGAVNAALSGNGGGRGTLAQGSAKKPSDLAETVDHMRGYFRSVLLHG